MSLYITGTHAPGWDESGLAASVRDYLRIGIAKGHRNDALFWAACQFRDSEFDQAQAEAQLLSRGLADGLAASEILKVVKSAYQKPPRETAKAKGSTATSKGTAPPMNTTLPSPIPDGFRIFLETVFEQGERVAIGQGSLNPDGSLSISYGDVRLRKMWLKAGPPRNLEGVFARINPMVYRGAKNGEVTAYRNTLVEFDFDKSGQIVPKEIQYGVLLASRFPIRVIIDSGNKSLQALVGVDAANKAEFEERREIVYGHFRQYDFFDEDNKAENKYCRLPGCDRQLFDQNGKPGGMTRQELLAVGIGPASWAEWQKGQQATQDECRQHDLEETARLRREDRPFPAPMDDAAYYGIAGEIVNIIAPGNEPCRESLLGHFLIAAGNMIGWNAWMDQGDDQHLNEFGLFIGPSALGRKGTAWTLIKRLMAEVDHQWTTRRVKRALQSGEVLIHNIRDPSTKSSGKKTYTDPGVADKRMVIMESEITRFLTVGKRRGNNLFDVTHDCWDSLDPLCCDSKTAAEAATHPHVSMIAHGTPEAYLSQLPETEKTNGSVNRTLILAVYRAQKKAKPAKILWHRDHSDIIARLQQVLATFKTRRELDWSPEALAEWETFYNNFDSKTRGGMVSSILDRFPTHVVRIAMIYCALENCCLISSAHLQAAIAFCSYCRRSAEWLFGEKTGNARADRIYSAFSRAKPEGMSRTEIAEAVFNKKIAAAELDELLGLLLKAELIYPHSEPNPRKGPRYIQKFYAC